LPNAANLNRVNVRVAPVLLAGLILLVGCSRSTPGPVPASSSASSNAPLAIQRAQPRLTTAKLWVGPRELNAELALTANEIQTGMMFRTNTPESEGMLFLFSAPHRTSFWMKNVPVPLSCAYIDPDGIILEIHPMKAHDEAPIPAATDRVQFVLETAEGWFGRNGVTTGMLVRAESGPLTQLRRAASRR
jgi:uncharacterized protein